MKITDILKPNFCWNLNSYDVWISPDNIIYDLGESQTHYSWLCENFNNDSINSFLDKGWIKITNSKFKVTIEGKSEIITNKRNKWITPISERLKNDVFELELITEKYKKILILPKEQMKIFI